MGYIKVDGDGRVTAASVTHHCGEGEIEVDLPDVEIETIHDYRYVDGVFVHDPVAKEPEQTGPTDGERISALEQENAYLKETLEIILSGAVEDEDGESVEETGI